LAVASSSQCDVGVLFSHLFVFGLDRLQTAFKVISLLMVVAAVLQLSLISKREWDSFFGRVDRLQKRALKPARSLSFSAMDAVNSAMVKTFYRSASMPVVPAASPVREMFVIPDDAHLKYD
jgi:hypothetical protein